MAYARTYPLDCLPNLTEQFCHPLPNELDHCAFVVYFSCYGPSVIKVSLMFFNGSGDGFQFDLLDTK